jgi:hypothetical protein
MQRREIFRLLGAGAVLPLFDSNLLAMFQAAQPKSGYTLRTLDAHQNATLTLIADMIIPETDTPGAKGARVNEFIDLILTDWATDQERQKFMAGFAEVDQLSQTLFGKDFIDASPAQQEDLLRNLDQRFSEERSTVAHQRYVRRERDQELNGSFFNVVKRMTLYGYYTSEIGFTKELRKEIIPGVYHGCTPVSDSSKA